MKNLTPIQAIRQNCLECSCGSSYEVNNCIITDCPLYKYRLGKNPNRKGIGNSNPVYKFSSVNDREYKLSSINIG